MNHDGAAVTMEGERFEPDGYVYVLAGGGYCKIGRSRALSPRLARLETQSPFKVELENAFPCTDVAQAERTLHRRFADARANGEWFVLEPEDLDFLRRIGRMRGADIEFGEAALSWDFEGKERLTVYVPQDLVDRVKNAVYWTPGLTLARMAEEALLAEVERREKGQGGPFPTRAEELRGGRPMK